MMSRRAVGREIRGRKALAKGAVQIRGRKAPPKGAAKNRGRKDKIRGRKTLFPAKNSKCWVPSHPVDHHVFLGFDVYQRQCSA
jgi:hypothetical protein